MKDQKGFGLVGILAVILVISIIVTVGVGVSRNNSKQNQLVINQSHTESSDDDSSESAEEAAFTEEFYDDVARFSIKYPDGWTVSTEKSQQGPGHPIAKNIFTSPNGATLSINHDYGGRGGWCEPGSNDKPHQDTNNCPTFEYLSKQEIDAKVYGGYDYKGNKYPVNLVTAKFSEPGEQTSYMIGLSVDYPHEHEILVVSKPVMGAYMDFTNFPVYDKNGDSIRDLYTYASGDNEDFFNSEDGRTIMSILKSFRIDQ